MGDFTRTAGLLAAPFTGGASLLPTLLAVGAAGASIYAGKQAASAQRAQIEMQKRQEAAAATDREVQRQRRLAAILGSQRAAAAAAGVAASGSVANISYVDARRAAEDSLVDEINASNRIRALSSQSRSIRRISNVKAAGTILSTAESIYRRG